MFSTEGVLPRWGDRTQFCGRSVRPTLSVPTEAAPLMEEMNWGLTIWEAVD